MASVTANQIAGQTRARRRVTSEWDGMTMDLAEIDCNVNKLKLSTYTRGMDETQLH